MFSCSSKKEPRTIAWISRPRSTLFIRSRISPLAISPLTDSPLTMCSLDASSSMSLASSSLPLTMAMCSALSPTNGLILSSHVLGPWRSSICTGCAWNISRTTDSAVGWLLMSSAWIGRAPLLSTLPSQPIVVARFSSVRSPPLCAYSSQLFEYLCFLLLSHAALCRVIASRIACSTSTSSGEACRRTCTWRSPFLIW